MQRAAFGRWNWGEWEMAWGRCEGGMRRAFGSAVLARKGRRSGLGVEAKRATSDDAAARREQHHEKQLHDRPQQKKQRAAYTGKKAASNSSRSAQDRPAIAIRLPPSSASETASAAITASRRPRQPFHPSFERPRPRHDTPSAPLPLSAYRHVLC